MVEEEVVPPATPRAGEVPWLGYLYSPILREEFFSESYWLCLERLRDFQATAPKKITMSTTMEPHNTNVKLSEGWPKRSAIPAANKMKGRVQSTKTTVSSGVVPFLVTCLLTVAEPDPS
jgi:hypothetical protein